MLHKHFASQQNSTEPKALILSYGTGTQPSMQTSVRSHYYCILVPTTLSANFLYQNYKQVLHILEHEEYAMSVIERAGEYSRQDFPQFLQEELLYLNSLKADPPELTAQIEYANALKQYYESKYVLLQASYEWTKPIPYPRQKYDELSAQLTQLHSVDTPQDQLDPNLHAVKCSIIHCREKYDIALARVIWCENELSIDPEQVWPLDSSECLAAIKAAAEHAYRQALDSLSHAVVQHILELHKMGLPGTCRCSQPLFTNSNLFTWPRL